MKDKKDVVVKRYTQDLDTTEALRNLLRSLGKKEEKHILHELAFALSRHQIGLIKVLSQPELVKSITSFFQEAKRDYRKSLMASKLLSFRSMRSIEEEASRMAWADTKGMINELCLSREESVNEHMEILKKVCATLMELVKESPNAKVEIDRDAIEKLLKGGSE